MSEARENERRLDLLVLQLYQFLVHLLHISFDLSELAFKRGQRCVDHPVTGRGHAFRAKNGYEVLNLLI